MQHCRHAHVCASKGAQSDFQNGACDSSARVVLAKYQPAKYVGLSAGYNFSLVPARTHMRHAVYSHVTSASVYTTSMDRYHRRRGTGVQPQVNY